MAAIKPLYMCVVWRITLEGNSDVAWSCQWFNNIPPFHSPSFLRQNWNCLNHSPLTGLYTWAKRWFTSHFFLNSWIIVSPVPTSHWPGCSKIYIHPSTLCLCIGARHAATAGYFLWFQIAISNLKYYLQWYFTSFISNCGCHKMVVLPTIALIFCWVCCCAFITFCLSQQNSHSSPLFQ